MRYEDAKEVSQTMGWFTRLLSWPGWNGLSAIATLLAVMVAVGIYSNDQRQLQNDRESEVLALKQAYLQPLREVINRTDARLTKPATENGAITVPPIMERQLDRNWIMGSQGVAMNRLYDRLQAFNVVSNSTPLGSESSIELWRRRNGRVLEISDIATKLLDDFEADQR